MEPDHFDALLDDVRSTWRSRSCTCRTCGRARIETHRLNVRVVSPNAWHSVFVNNMFIDPPADAREDFEPGFTVLHAPELEADPARHGTRTGTFIALDFSSAWS
jgi:phosphoenolpyruvate carboxykinase (ATP)